MSRMRASVGRGTPRHIETLTAVLVGSWGSELSGRRRSQPFTESPPQRYTGVEAAMRRWTVVFLAMLTMGATATESGLEGRQAAVAAPAFAAASVRPTDAAGDAIELCRSV